eukprot:1947517-Rhodomonas_salina.1
MGERSCSTPRHHQGQSQRQCSDKPPSMPPRARAALRITSLAVSARKHALAPVEARRIVVASPAPMQVRGPAIHVSGHQTHAILPRAQESPGKKNKNKRAVHRRSRLDRV